MSQGGVTQRRTAGVLILFAVVQYFVCERLAASRWASVAGHHGYDYAKNWISDLAAPGRPAEFEGALFVSPLHALMTASLATLALLGLVAGLMLTRLVPASRLRLVMRALVVVFASGVGLVAMFPETTHVTVHNTGASLTVAADVLAVLVGVQGPALRLPRWTSLGCLAFGVLGGGVGVLFACDVLDSAVVERIADYAPMAACLVGGVATLLPARAAVRDLVIDLTDAALTDAALAGDRHPISV